MFRSSLVSQPLLQATSVLWSVGWPLRRTDRLAEERMPASSRVRALPQSGASELAKSGSMIASHRGVQWRGGGGGGGAGGSAKQPTACASAA
eukprot:SAG31_NODE_1348_length_8693_cov_4.345008_1_plen_92_part_00